MSCSGQESICLVKIFGKENDMRFMSRHLSCLPLFNRHKTIWRKAMEIRKKYRRKQKEFNEKVKCWEDHLEYKKKKMQETYCPFVPTGTDCLCKGIKCVHYDAGYLSVTPVKSIRYLSDRYAIEGRIRVESCSCKLWREGV